MKKVFFFLFILSAIASSAQNPASENGYTLPANGRIRVLLVFLEMKYPGNPPAPEVTSWKPGQLPDWKDQVFDPYFSGHPQGVVSRYYHESSLGCLDVCGDMVLNPDDPGKPFEMEGDGVINVSAVIEKITAQKISTLHNFPVDSFNLSDKTKPGLPKNYPDTKKAEYDHLMIIVRNAKYPGSGSGFANGSTLISKNGISFESYSVFASENILPARILLHEFNHLLSGGNNEHCCGGNHAASGPQMLLSFEGGWGMMGANNSSFQTCNAWDRYFLNWKPVNRTYRIGAHNLEGNYINNDFAYQELKDTTYVVLRDFLSSGDALRIKLPGIPDSLYSEFLWLENHQTSAFNKSPFDEFQFQEYECRDKALAGLYAYIQIDHDKLFDKNLYQGYADFIRPLPANGNFDFIWGDTLVQNDWCVNNRKVYPYELIASRANPLSGYNEMELLPNDNNNDGRTGEKEKRECFIRQRGGTFYNNLPFFGTEEHVFSLATNDKISMTGNPSSNNVLTLVNDDRDILNSKAPNHRAIYLNPVSVEIVKENYPEKGSILVRIVKNDVMLNGKVRWCAPKIILQALSAEQKEQLHLLSGSKLLIDQGYSIVQIEKAQVLNGENVFAPPTVMIVRKGSKIIMDKRSQIIIDHNSLLIIEEGAEIVMHRKAKLICRNGGIIENKGTVTKLK